jgi:hypothetical protein
VALGSRGGLAGVAVLGSAPALRGVVTLDLTSLGDGDVKMLADAPGLDALRNLDLSRSWFGDVGLSLLARSPLLARLHRLRVSTNGKSPEALQGLARAVAETPRCRLVLIPALAPAARKSLARILGERLTVE